MGHWSGRKVDPSGRAAELRLNVGLFCVAIFSCASGEASDGVQGFDTGDKACAAGLLREYCVEAIGSFDLVAGINDATFINALLDMQLRMLFVTSRLEVSKTTFLVVGERLVFDRVELAHTG